MHDFPACERFGFRPLKIQWAVAVACAVGCLYPAAASAQTASPETVLVESAAASRVVDKVRAAAPGVFVEMFVQVGDEVKKGQILGNIDCDAAKLQLDLARQAMDAKGSLEAARGQAEAWTVTREETEEAVRHRTAAKSRLDWARAMEKMYRSTYDAQVDAQKTKVIQYEYCKEQYEKRFFRAPIDGVVSEVLAEIGKPVTFGSHVFTIRNETIYAVPVAVPASLAAGVAESTVPVRAADGKSVCRALVDSVMNDPHTAGGKIIRLLVRSADFPALARGDLLGMKFDVLLPQIAGGCRP